MKTEWIRCGNKLICAPEGELGHREALGVMAELPKKVLSEAPSMVELDMSKVGFMDSSGIAVVITARKNCIKCGAGFRVTGVRPQAMRVFAAAGLEKYADITPLEKIGARSRK